MKARLLIVEDEEILRRSFAEALEKMGYLVVEAEGLGAARRLLLEESPDVVLSDIRLPDGSGLDLLEEAASLSPDIVFLFMTAHAAVEGAVEVMRRGAYTYLTKPIHPTEVAIWIERALAQRRSRRVAETAEGGEGDKDSFLGQGDKTAEIRRFVSTVAPTPTTVLLLGETGTGKDLVARWIHRASARAGRFVPVNMAGLTAGLLEAELFGYERGAFTGAVARRIGLVEAAEGGTLFLDEIADISPDLQVRLLRLLDTGKIRRVGGTKEIQVDVRFLAATNRNLGAEVRAGRFREDLFYRLSRLSLLLPPLRDRPEDIPLLAEHFARAAARRLGKPFEDFDRPTLEKLRRYPWPGNVRELSAAMERGILLSSFDLPECADPGAIREEAIPLPPPEMSYHEAKERVLTEFERRYLRRAYLQTGENLSETARRIGLDRKHLAHKLRAEEAHT